MAESCLRTQKAEVDDALESINCIAKVCKSGVLPSAPLRCYLRVSITARLWINLKPAKQRPSYKVRSVKRERIHSGFIRHLREQSCKFVAIGIPFTDLSTMPEPLAESAEELLSIPCHMIAIRTDAPWHQRRSLQRRTSSKLLITA